jgi:Glycosyl hydrolase family 20, catalytic domain
MSLDNLHVLFLFLIAIGKSHPEFLSLCYNKGRSEPLDVTNTAVYDFVHGLYAEITQLFPDEWIHLGGDEGNFSSHLIDVYPLIPILMLSYLTIFSLPIKQ